MFQVVAVPHIYLPTVSFQDYTFSLGMRSTIILVHGLYMRSVVRHIGAGDFTRVSSKAK